MFYQTKITSDSRNGQRASGVGLPPSPYYSLRYRRILEFLFMFSRINKTTQIAARRTMPPNLFFKHIRNYSYLALSGNQCYLKFTTSSNFFLVEADEVASTFLSIFPILSIDTAL